MNNFSYKGVTIRVPIKQPKFSHSVPLMIASFGKYESNENIPYFEKLMRYRETDVPEGDLLHSVCALYSVKNLSYQVNNGGFAQYFDNGFHKYRVGYDIGDLTHLDMEQQIDFLKELILFILLDTTKSNYSSELSKTLYLLQGLVRKMQSKTYCAKRFFDFMDFTAYDEQWFKVTELIEWGLETYAQYLVKRLEEMKIEPSDKQTGIL